jgi:hypothetical protein
VRSIDIIAAPGEGVYATHDILVWLVQRIRLRRDAT